MSIAGKDKIISVGGTAAHTIQPSDVYCDPVAVAGLVRSNRLQCSLETDVQADCD